VSTWNLQGRSSSPLGTLLCFVVRLSLRRRHKRIFIVTLLGAGASIPSMRCLISHGLPMLGETPTTSSSRERCNCPQRSCSSTQAATRNIMPACSRASIADLEQDDFSSSHHPALPLCWSMIFFRKPVPTFRDHALASTTLREIRCNRESGKVVTETRNGARACR
jgi:hypothetical protein